MKTRSLLTLLTLALTTHWCAAADNWTALFDGKTLTGWTQRGGKAKYEIQDGVIVGTTVLDTPNSFLCTEKLYGNFILELDFKVDPKLNSGIQIRSESFDKEKSIEHGGKTIKVPAGRVHGYQCEIDMDPGRARWWTAGLYDEGRRAWLNPGPLGGDGKAFTEQGGKISKPDGWNHVRIECRGDKLKTWLNGEPRAEITDSLTPRGFIALQVHSHKEAGLQVHWKNIRIQDLTK